MDGRWAVGFTVVTNISEAADTFRYARLACTTVPTWGNCARPLLISLSFHPAIQSVPDKSMFADTVSPNTMSITITVHALLSFSRKEFWC